jgi:thymidine kinase
MCGQVLDVVSVADSVTKLAGRCAYCDRPALFSLRIAADSRQAVVGGADKYAPVCRRHYSALSQPAAPDQDAGERQAGAHSGAGLNGSLAAKT